MEGGAESEWLVKKRMERESEERIRLEAMLDNQEYSDDYEINKKLYEVYKQRFASSAVRNDTNDIKIVQKLRLPIEENA